MAEIKGRKIAYKKEKTEKEKAYESSSQSGNTQGCPR